MGRELKITSSALRWDEVTLNADQIADECAHLFGNIAHHLLSGSIGASSESDATIPVFAEVRDGKPIECITLGEALWVTSEMVTATRLLLEAKPRGMIRTVYEP